ncbi:MAG: STAS domain-containing protein [candidate division FCPU426 bacterium]
MKHMKITQDLREGVHLLTVSGFMDMTSVPKFEAALDELIAQGVIHIVLDLSYLEFITSAGLGAIIGRIRRVRQQEGDIKVGGCSDRVMEVLKTFGFTDVFQVSPTAEAALAQFKTTPS